MPIVSITEFKAHFSEYLRRVLAGEVFYITNRGVEVAEFRPTDPTRKIAVGAWSSRPASMERRQAARSPSTCPQYRQAVSDIVLEDSGPCWD